MSVVPLLGHGIHCQLLKAPVNFCSGGKTGSLALAPTSSFVTRATALLPAPLCSSGGTVAVSCFRVRTASLRRARRLPATVGPIVFAVAGSTGDGSGDDIYRESSKVAIAVFVSGGGSNLRSLHAATVDGRIQGSIVAIVTDKPGCGGADFARAAGIPVLEYPPPKNASGGMSTDDLIEALRRSQVRVVALAGYLKLLPEALVRAFPRAIVNIHPSLLPAFGGKGFYGGKVHKAVIACGARVSGATVHFVDEAYDRGPIVAQRCVPVVPQDTAESLATRVLEQEHDMYPAVVAALCDGRVEWREDGVPLIRTSEDGQAVIYI